MKALTLSILVGLAIFFHPLWLKGKLPFPGHLLVSFFSPFKEITWPGYPVGVPRQDLLGFDTVRMIYPWQAFTIQELKAGRLPLWNPHSFAGAPHLANWQSAVFFPLNWLYLVLPQATAWTLLTLLQPILAAIFAYLFLRHLKFKSQSSLIAATAYGFSGWLSAWIGWNSLGFAYAFLPLALLLLSQSSPLVLLPLIFIALSGHPQVALLVLIFCFIYGLSQHLSWKFLITVFSLTLLITAIQWLPTAEYYREASREQASSEFSLDRTALPWTHLATLVASTYFGHPATGNYWGSGNFTETTMFVSTAVIILAFLGISKSFFSYAALLILIFVLPTPLLQAIKLTSLPLLSTSVISRALILLPLCLVVLAARGLDQFKPYKPKKLIVFIGFILLSFTLIAILEKTHTSTTLRQLIIPAGISLSTLLILLLGSRHRPLTWIFIPLILFDLGFFAKKTLTFTERELVFPQVPVINFLQSHVGFDRIGAEKSSNIEGNLPLYYHLSTAEGYDALYPRRVGELIWAAQAGQYKSDFSRSTVVVPQFENKLNPRIMDLLSLKYIINQNKNLSWPADKYKLVWQQDNWQVYENKQTLPRAQLFNQYQVIADSKTAIETLLDSQFDYQHTLILSQSPPIDPQPDLAATATITQYLPQTIIIASQSVKPQLLLLNDTYYPGWQAAVDGQKTPVIRANHAFRAVSLPAGSHQVIFSYQPLSVKLGSLISLIGILGAVIVFKHYETFRHHSGL